MCPCFGCGGVGGVGGEWVGVLGQGLGGFGGLMSVSVVSLDSLCIWQVQVSVYCARWIPTQLHPVFYPVAPYRYLLPNLYLSVANIANPDLLACGGRTWVSLDMARFYEEHCQPFGGMADLPQQQ